MRPSHRFVVSAATAALVLLFASCAAPPPPAPEVDLAAEAQEIRDLSARWMEYAASRDLAAIVDLFAEDAVTLSDGEPPREGRAAIQANMQTEWAANPDFVIRWSTTSVKVAASADLAWELGTYEYDPDGAGPAQPSPGEYVTLYRKVDEDWKVALDIGVSTEPEAEALE